MCNKHPKIYSIKRHIFNYLHGNIHGLQFYSIVSLIIGDGVVILIMYLPVFHLFTFVFSQLTYSLSTLSLSGRFEFESQWVAIFQHKKKSWVTKELVEKYWYKL